MENSLTLIDLVEKKPQELVAKQTTEQQAQTYIALDMLTKALKEEEKQALLKSGIDKFEWTLPNGTVKTLTITHGSTRTEDVVERTIDIKAVEEFAKASGYVIPMTQPQIDMEKLESLEWFQNNVERFVKKEIKTKTIKSNNTLKVK